MRRLPPHLAPLGYSPRRYLPLSPAPVLGMGERLTDLRDLQQMFANGEQGGYWPADPAYAYEDSAGTTLASVNGVVGLRFDVIKGLAVLSEITGSNLNVANGWVKYGNNTIVDDGTAIKLTYVDNLSGMYFYLRNSTGGTTRDLITGEMIIVYIDAKISSGSTTIEFVPNDITSGIDKSFSSTEDYVNVSCLFSSALSGAHPYIRVRCSVGQSVWIKNIKVYPIDGRPAIQAATANKPYLRATPTTGKYWCDSNTATGAMNVTFASALGSSCTIATVTPEGVSILENQTVGTTYNICPPYGYNSDVLIINRALTAAEKALVTRVMTRNVPVLGSELITNGSFQPVNDGGIGHDNGNGTVDGWTVQNNSYLSVINEKLTIRSATSITYSAGYITLSGINGQLLVSAKMERIINSYPYLFLVSNSVSPYNQYVNITINSATINIKQAVLVPASITPRFVFYANSANAVDQTVTVADFSVKAIL